MTLFGLFGGFGEFDEWAAEVHRKLVGDGNGDGSVRILPMSYGHGAIPAEELTFFERLGIPTDVVGVTSRSEAEQVEVAKELSDASLIFLHGGMPDWMCEVLRDTPVWHAILAALHRGASFAGTSGGIACLGKLVPSFERESGEVTWLPGLNVFSNAVIGAHWDNSKYEWLSRPFRSLRDTLVVAVDERTTLVGDGNQWEVFGEGAAHHLRDNTYADHESSATFHLDLGMHL